MAVLNPGDNQIIPLTTKRPMSYFSGCRLTNSRDKARNQSSITSTPTSTEFSQNGSETASTASDEMDSSYFEQFLKSSTSTSYTTTANPTTPYLSVSTDQSENGAYEEIFLDTDTDVFNATDNEFVLLARDHNDGILNGNRLENDTSFQEDVEELFSDSSTEGSVRVRRSISLFSRENTGTIIVTCNNAGGFQSVRERWWYIAISNCGSDKGIDIKYRFKMTNGPPGDFWHEHFSADETCEFDPGGNVNFDTDLSILCRHSTNSTCGNDNVHGPLVGHIPLCDRTEDSSFIPLHISFVCNECCTALLWRPVRGSCMDQIRSDWVRSLHNPWRDT